MMGCTWTPRRPNGTFARSRIPPPPPLLSSPGTSARLCSPEASHYITFVLHFFKTLYFLCVYRLLIPSHASPSSKRHDVTLAPISWDRVTASRLAAACLDGGSFGLAERKTEFPACEEEKKNQTGRKKKPKFQLFFFGGFFFSFQFLTGVVYY